MTYADDIDAPGEEDEFDTDDDLDEAMTTSTTSTTRTTTKTTSWDGGDEVRPDDRRRRGQIAGGSQVRRSRPCPRQAARGHPAAR